ncbi:hypothetical protein GQ55_1G323600 [Panicum hallii var. hallii]|uniref:PGG domain-containing protein n=1 Tax=Panicum hallii var. hallii TaxID=1504633 RepID=A0A2T7F9V7_9POAL|nr:hypothetical protein GQ55_1G323600 [Panicum hallii var. hallii]
MHRSLQQLVLLADITGVRPRRPRVGGARATPTPARAGGVRASPSVLVRVAARRGHADRPGPGEHGDSGGSEEHRKQAGGADERPPPPPAPPPTLARMVASPPSIPTTTASPCPTPVAPDLEFAATAGGNTLLHVAAAAEHADLASLLLRRAQRRARHTAPPRCPRRGAQGHRASRRLLRAIPAFPDPCQKRRGETSLHDAGRRGHEAASGALATADPGLVGLCGGAGESPFYMAAAGGGWRS